MLLIALAPIIPFTYKRESRTQQCYFRHGRRYQTLLLLLSQAATLRPHLSIYLAMLISKFSRKNNGLHGEHRGSSFHRLWPTTKRDREEERAPRGRTNGPISQPFIVRVMHVCGEYRDSCIIKYRSVVNLWPLIQEEGWGGGGKC